MKSHTTKKTADLPSHTSIGVNPTSIILLIFTQLSVVVKYYFYETFLKPTNIVYDNNCK